MASLKFNSLFAGLMGLGFLTAFILPGQLTTAGPGGVGIAQGMFSPVSRPVRALSGFFYRRFHTETVVDDRSPTKVRDQSSVYEENHQLLTAYASLQAKFDQLSQLNADRQAVGDIRPLCKPATVTGAEVSGLREALTINAAVPAAMLMGRPVIRGNPSQSPLPCDLIGKVDRSGPMGARVLLVTDPGSSLVGRICRNVPLPDGKFQVVYADKIPPPLIRGIGHNAMTVSSNLTMQQVAEAGIAVNDVVLLNDKDWPGNIQGFEVGRIVSITRRSKAPLLADIRIEPAFNLMRLSEVMVMVRD